MSLERVSLDALLLPPAPRQPLRGVILPAVPSQVVPTLSPQTAALITSWPGNVPIVRTTPVAPKQETPPPPSAEALVEQDEPSQQETSLRLPQAGVKLTALAAQFMATRAPVAKSKRTPTPAPKPGPVLVDKTTPAVSTPKPTTKPAPIPKEIKMTDKTTDTNIELQPVTTAIAKHFTDAAGDIQISANGEEGEIKGIGRDFYLARATDAGLDEQTLQRVADFHTDLVPGTTLGVGQAAIPVFAANPGLKSVSVSVPLLGKDHFNVKINREQITPGGAGGEVRTSYGTTTQGFENYNTKNRGELSKVKQLLSAQAKAQYGEK